MIPIYQPRFILQDFSFTDACIFLELHRQSKKYSKVYSSRKTISRGKVSEKTVTRSTNKQELHGLIEKSRREGMPFDTCHYVITNRGLKMKDYILSIYNATKYGIFSISLLIPTATPGVPLCKLSGMYKECKLVGSRESVTAPAPATPLQPSNSDRKKESRKQSMEFPPHIEQLTAKLQLTTHGKLKLNLFSPTTIEQAVGQLKSMQGSNDLFKGLINECLSIATAGNETVQWSTYYKALEAGVADKKDAFTKVKVTHKSLFSGGGITGRPPTVDNQKELVARERERMRQKQADWEAKKGAAHVQNNLRQFLPTVSGITQEFGAPQEMLVAIQPRSSAPTWSAEDQALVDWALNYIDSMTVTKHAYGSMEKNLLSFHESKVDLGIQVRSDLILMRSLAERTYQPPVEKVVTEIQNQIVCAVVEADDEKWRSVEYAPFEEEDGWVEML